MARHDDDGFVVYEAQTRPRRLRSDEVSLTKTNIVISEELAHAHLNGVKCIVLLFDPERQLIGIREVRDGESGYKLSYRSVSARSFYQHFGIEARGRFPTQFENGMLVVRLEKDEAARWKTTP